jgi:3-(3-hydroxy-phenyl)propionate hydroxylase
MKSFDVIIIGYGPTGGTLASLLVKSNLSVMILEKEKSLYPLPRAVHFDDEIMRVFETIGIKEKFKKFTIINKGTKFVDNTGKVLLDWPRPREITQNGSYPSYRFHQPDFERVIRNHLKGYKNFLSKQNSNVIKIKNTKNYVEIKVENTETFKQDTLRCKYLVGCDGANSITRKKINSQFDNLGFNQKWAVIDLILKKNKKLPDRTIQYANAKQPATYCRNVGKSRRWEFAIKK